jgi:inorganic pyrophosphatase
MGEATWLEHQLDRETGACRVVLAEPDRERARSARVGRTGDAGLAQWLPDGADFSLHLGYVPATRGFNGEPLDVIVLDALGEAETVTGVRIIGVLHADHTEAGLTSRDERLVAVGEASVRFAAVQEIDDLGPDILALLRRAWTAYNVARCASYQVVGLKGAAHAFALIEGAASRRLSPRRRERALWAEWGETPARLGPRPEEI